MGSTPYVAPLCHWLRNRKIPGNWDRNTFFSTGYAEPGSCLFSLWPHDSCILDLSSLASKRRMQSAPVQLIYGMLVKALPWEVAMGEEGLEAGSPISWASVLTVRFLCKIRAPCILLLLLLPLESITLALGVPSSRLTLDLGEVPNLVCS